MSISQDDFPARKNIPKLYKPYGKSKGNVGTLFDLSLFLTLCKLQKFAFMASNSTSLLENHVSFPLSPFRVSFSKAFMT